MLTLLEEAYGNNLRLVYRHFPLTSIHDKAQITAEAAEAAGAQGKFWAMHDLLFDRWSEWASLPAEQMPQVLTGYARELGLDVDRFTRDLEGHTYQAKVMDAYQAALALGLPGTPSFVLNGRFVSDNGALPTLLDEVIAQPRRYEPPAQQVDPARKYTATLHTPQGEIVIELYADRAPLSVNSVVFLAREGWYDGPALFRWGSDFVLQGGDPAGLAFRNPGFQCPAEIGDLRFDGPGVVGMLGPGPDITSGRFFITLMAIPSLDGRYTVIGKVVKGLDLLQGIPEETSAAGIPSRLKIETIRVEEQ